MNVPDELRYSSDHEWISRDGDTVTIGITDFAQDSLGDVVFVELPEVGQVVAASDTFTEVESTKSVSDIYAPVSGTISEANPLLDEQPELLNSDPYGDGWICRIDMSDPTQFDALLDAGAYRELIEG
ncbi:glycine cleavage system protein GcvH [Ilumatobacter sp.]|uniref:glycine cleavage system protein GcvH n=1 Tax=Ilumatobacter sp. TaxID=1967498 RepID=UPI003C5492F3